jgi:hypothetical protein
VARKAMNGKYAEYEQLILLRLFEIINRIKKIPEGSSKSYNYQALQEGLTGIGSMFFPPPSQYSTYIISGCNGKHDI